MVYTKRRSGSSGGDTPVSDKDESPSNKRARSGVCPKKSPATKTPERSSPADVSTKSVRSAKERNDTPIPQLDTPSKRGTRRSMHLLVTPAPQMERSSPIKVPINVNSTPPQVQSLQTPTKRGRPPGRPLSTNLGDAPPQIQTPTRRSRRVSTDLSDAPPQVATPTRRSRRLSTDLSDAPPQVATPTRLSRRLSTDLGDAPRVQTPTRRSAKLQTKTPPSEAEVPIKKVKGLDLDEPGPVTVQTPTRRSRRNSTEPGDITKPVLPQVEALTRRSTRRLSTDLTDSPAPPPSTPTRRSRRLSTDLTDDIPEVQTPTRRSRRLSTGDQEVAEEKTPLKRAGVSASGDDSGNAAVSSRKSRRVSGASLIVSLTEKSMDTLEEETEEEEMETASKSEGLEIIVENEKEEESGLKSPESPEILPLKNLEVIEEESDDELEVLEVKLSPKKAMSTKKHPETKKDSSNKSRTQDVDSSKLTNDDELEIVEEIVPSKKKTKEDLQSQDKSSDSDDMLLILEEEEPCNKDINDIQESKQKDTAEVVDEKKKDKKEVSIVSSKRSPARSSPKTLASKRPTSTISGVLSSKNITSTNSSSGADSTPDSQSALDIQTPSKVLLATFEKENAEISTVRQNGEKEDAVVSSTTNMKRKKKVVKEQPSDVTDDPELEWESNNNKLKPIRGMPVSGRCWKREKNRCSSINKDMGPKTSWEEKMKRKQEKRDSMTLKKSLHDSKLQKKADLRERQKFNTMRREENARKSEIVQVIKDSRKIKKMKRKQLRYIETRDTDLLKKV